MLQDKGTIVIDDLTGGINQKDAPHAIGDTQAVDLRNIEWTTSRFARKRNGSMKTITGVLPWGVGTSVASLMRHTATGDERNAELWGVSTDATPKLARIAAGSAWATVSTGDNIDAAEPEEVYGASLNGKLFLSYKSAVDRLHLWNGSVVRRVGLPKPAVPTVANQGAGAYAAVKRWYRVQWYNNAPGGGGIEVLSPLSDPVSITPSGTGTAIRITRPTAPGEHELGWILYGSADGVNYYVIIGTPVIGTTFLDDTLSPVAYAAFSAGTFHAPLTALAAIGGYYTPPPSGKYLMADESRLLMAGSWTTSAYQSRVWWTPVLNSSPGDVTIDDERIPPNNYKDLNPSEGGEITGFGGPIDGAVYVFKRSHIYKLVRTGNVDDPYRIVPVSKVVGAIHQRTIVLGEDEAGAPAIYFLSLRGPYRLSARGLEYLGRDIEPIWGSVNLLAAWPSHGVYHRERGQVWWWVPFGGVQTPNLRLKFTVEYGAADAQGRIRGGWTLDDGQAANCLASVLFAETLGTTMGLRLRPYASLTAGNGEVYMHDALSIFRDNNDSVSFAASGVCKAYAFAGLGRFAGVDRVYVQGTLITPSVLVQVGMVRDFGAETRTATVDLTPPAGATRAIVPVEELTFAQCRYLQPTFGDPAAQNAGWRLDLIVLRGRQEDPL